VVRNGEKKTGRGVTKEGLGLGALSLPPSKGDKWQREPKTKEELDQDLDQVTKQEHTVA